MTNNQRLQQVLAKKIDLEWADRWLPEQQDEWDRCCRERDLLQALIREGKGEEENKPMF